MHGVSSAGSNTKSLDSTSALPNDHLVAHKSWAIKRNDAGTRTTADYESHWGRGISVVMVVVMVVVNFVELVYRRTKCIYQAGFWEVLATDFRRMSTRLRKSWFRVTGPWIQPRMEFKSLYIVGLECFRLNYETYKIVFAQCKNYSNLNM